MKHTPLTGAELNVFGSDAWRHPITGGIIETGRGAAAPVDQALAHAAALERTDEKAGKAMREAVIADHNKPKLKPVAKLQAEQKIEMATVVARQKSEVDTLEAAHKAAIEAAQLEEKKAVDKKAKDEAAAKTAPTPAYVPPQPQPEITS
jgi:hypothetical protein